MDDYAAIENLTNSTFDHELLPEQSAYYLACEIIFVILCAFGICLDSFIIHTMFNFKQTHTVANVFIAHWAIADLCSLIVIPINYRLLEIVDGVKLPFLLGAFLYQIEEILHNAFILFIASVLTEWCLAAYFPRASEHFRKRYAFVVTIIWALTLLSLCVSFGLSLYNLYFHIPMVFLFFGYFALFIFTFVLQFYRLVHRCCTKRASNCPTLTLTLATIVVVCWMPVWLSLIVEDLNNRFFPLLACSVLSSSFITFVVLYRGNKDFQACFLQALKCTNNKYQDEICESDDCPKNGNPMQVCFHQNGKEER